MPAKPSPHVLAAQLYPLMHALHIRPPPTRKGEEEDSELSRLIGALPERFARPPAQKQRLTPENVRKLLDHTAECRECRIKVFEDGPGCQSPKTESELAAEESVSERERRAMVKQFWVGMGAGIPAFVGAQFTINAWRNNQPKPIESEQGALEPDPIHGGARQIDPLLILFVLLILICSFGLTASWQAARTLWLDFTAWKRAVPVIGRRWAEASAEKEQAKHHLPRQPPPRQPGT